MKISSSKKTVAFVDLVGYSAKAAQLENIAGAAAVATFNAAIQDTISSAIKACGVARQDTVVMTTGDGAILMFDDPNKATQFAFELRHANDARNAGVADSAAHHHYRTGIATGEVAIDSDATEGNGLGGMAMIRAARLESKAPRDGALVDPETWQLLTDELQSAFIGPEAIAGKRDETFPAYRWGEVQQGETKDIPLATVGSAELKRNILDQLDKLTLAIQIDRLGIKLGIPANQMPAAVQTVEARALELLQWAEAYQSLYKLSDELTGLLGKIGTSGA